MAVSRFFAGISRLVLFIDESLFNPGGQTNVFYLG